MIMKWLNFNSIIGMAVLSLLFYTENVAAQTDKTIPNKDRYHPDNTVEIQQI